MSDCTLGYTKQFSAVKIEAIETWAAKWNTIKRAIEFRDVTLEDQNYNEGLIVTQEEREEYLSKVHKYQKMVEYTVKNASKECWEEQRQISQMS